MRDDGKTHVGRPHPGPAAPGAGRTWGQPHLGLDDPKKPWTLDLLRRMPPLQSPNVLLNAR
jgi:hypothetical protein